MQLIVLADYDNIKEVRKERSYSDTEFNIGAIVDSVSRIRVRSFDSYKDVLVRLYGGWTDCYGRQLESAAWASKACIEVRGRRRGGRIVPVMAYGLYDCSYPALRGLYRNGGQKMVDTLIVADALRISMTYGTKTLIMSDDEDMLPGVLATHLHDPKSTVVRGRVGNIWHNSQLISACGVQIESGVLA